MTPALQESVMASIVARGRLEELQVYRLLQCVHEGNKLQIEKLISRGVDNLLNLTEPRQGKGAMHLAAVANNTDMLDFLLSHGASPDVQDKMGRTPVMLAAELGHDGVVALLVKHKANVSLLDEDGKGERTVASSVLRTAFGCIVRTHLFLISHLRLLNYFMLHVVFHVAMTFFIQAVSSYFSVICNA